MSLALAFLAAVMVAASAFTMVFMAEMMAFVTAFLAHSWGIWFAIAIRVVLAVLLWGAASASRTPVTFKVLAILMLLAAISIPVMGPEYLQSLLQWFQSQSHWLQRGMAALGMVFGGFILWSISDQWATSPAAPTD